MAEEAWQECHFLRHLSRDECVIRLAGTGAILCVGLAVPLEATRACMVSALKPAPARVLLGSSEKDPFRITGCRLEVEWPMPSMPDPTRFVRRPVARRKRRRLG